MSYTSTPRVGLRKPDNGSHAFSLAEYQYNLDRLDAAPGLYVATSSSRPSWTAAEQGRLIYETDSGLVWRWSGSEWQRHLPVGLLGTSTLTADFGTTNTTAQSALACSVTVPAFAASAAARKRVRISASWFAADNGTASTGGICEISLLRGSTVLVTERVVGRPEAANADYLSWGTGGSIIAFDAPTVGAQTYAVAINSVSPVGGTSTLRASAPKPTIITVEEVSV